MGNSHFKSFAKALREVGLLLKSACINIHKKMCIPIIECVVTSFQWQGGVSNNQMPSKTVSHNECPGLHDTTFECLFRAHFFNIYPDHSKYIENKAC